MSTINDITVTNSIKSREMERIIPFIVSEKLEKQIKYLCSKFPSVEWSGILFIKPEGRLSDSDFKLIGTDLFLMDIGNPTYTEFFTHNDEMFEYQMNNDLLDNVVGLIHSHNDMKVFFSGTDQSTLLEEANERNHFISLIVNNKGEYCARITRKITKIIKAEYILEYNTFGDDIVRHSSDGVQEQLIEEIQYFNCKVVNESDNLDTDILDKCIHSIQESKKERAKSSIQTTHIVPNKLNQGSLFPNSSYSTTYPPKDTPAKIKYDSKLKDLNEDKEEDIALFLINIIEELVEKRPNVSVLYNWDISNLAKLLLPVLNKISTDPEFYYQFIQIVDESKIITFGNISTEEATELIESYSHKLGKKLTETICDIFNITDSFSLDYIEDLV